MKTGGELTTPLFFFFVCFFFFNKNDQKSPKKWSKVYSSAPTRIQPNLFKFSSKVVLPKGNLLSMFRSSTTSSYHTSRLSHDPPLTQL